MKLDDYKISEIEAVLSDFRLTDVPLSEAQVLELMTSFNGAVRVFGMRRDALGNELLSALTGIFGRATA